MSSCIWPCFGKWPVSCLLDENRCTEDSSLILVCCLWTVSCWEIWVLKPRKFASSVGPNVNARACNLHTQCHKKEAKAKGRCMTLCDIYHIILSRVGADLFNFCLNLINTKIKEDKLMKMQRMRMQRMRMQQMRMRITPDAHHPRMRITPGCASPQMHHH